jgi:hypothetical protein
MPTRNDRPDNSIPPIPYQLGQDGKVTVVSAITSVGGNPNIDKLGATVTEPNWSAGVITQNNASSLAVSGSYSGLSASVFASPASVSVSSLTVSGSYSGLSASVLASRDSGSVSGQVKLSLDNFKVNASSGPQGNKYDISFETHF